MQGASNATAIPICIQKSNMSAILFKGQGEGYNNIA